MWRSEVARLVAIGLVLGALASTGCVEHALREGRAPLDYSASAELRRAPPTDGAIWPGTTSGGSFLFFDQKARGVGDLVTVLIAEDLRAKGEALTDLQSTRELDVGLDSDVGFSAMIAAPIRGLLRALGLSNVGSGPSAGTTMNVVGSTSDNNFEGEGSTERKASFQGVMTCRVVGVLSDGLLHLRGQRYVVVNHEGQYVTLEGLVRRQDISINNTVASTKLAEARITYDGLGVLDDKQRPGLLARVLDWVYPF